MIDRIPGNQGIYFETNTHDDGYQPGLAAGDGLLNTKSPVQPLPCTEISLRWASRNRPDENSTTVLLCIAFLCSLYYVGMSLGLPCYWTPPSCSSPTT